MHGGNPVVYRIGITPASYEVWLQTGNTYHVVGKEYFHVVEGRNYAYRRRVTSEKIISQLNAAVAEHLAAQEQK
ncbi:MAG: hypothetical protein RSA68_03740 [Hafnia sp.]|uniref:hypothetical protein n=1 Tax=Hafnia sp. TaxID=1873498 RepID=UPI002FC7FFB7